MLQQSKLEEIFDRPFKDDGSNYVALCPVHKERTPSFCVHKESAIYHCFGCKIKGRLVNFIRDYKGVDESAALKLLGLSLDEILDIELNAVSPPKPATYPESWLAPFKKEIHKYVLNRNFTSETLRRAETLYDHSAQRQVFPHRRRDGKLVGAIGRSCTGKEPKWWFYWGYEKGRHIYEVPGVSLPSIAVWIVEGVFDALWLYQHGYNAVATLGSKATDQQLSEIKDLSDTLILAYDNDEAGLAGTRDLVTRLKRHKTLLSPSWPRWDIDIMNTDPTKLPLYNTVESELVKAGCLKEAYIPTK